MLTIEKYNDKEYITKVYNFIHKYDFNRNNTITIDDILKNENEKANLFLSFITMQIKNFNDKEEIPFSKINHEPLKEKLSIELLEKIISYSTKNIEPKTDETLQKLFPYLKLIDTIKYTPWQCYYENNVSGNIILEIYKKLINAEAPFSDKRFRALPINTNGYRKGYNCSNWLKNESGGISKYWNEKEEEFYLKRNENCYKNIFIDAKIGFVIFFKDKPSITISFNYDNDKNIYIHQIQAQIKDRGHYKIKGNWRTETIKYLQSIFSNFSIHLISGEHIIKLVKSNYNKDSGINISQNTLDKIKYEYDNIMTNCSKKVERGDFKYRTLFF